MATRYGLIGAAGFIAPRHVRAIKETGGNLIAAVDPSDSVGMIDGFFPETQFFTSFEQFDCHVDNLRRSGEPLDYIAICSPNHLHDAHIRFTLRSGADAICEKPLVLTPAEIDRLLEIEDTYRKKVNTILQLRIHPAVVDLRNRILSDTSDRQYNVTLTYITSRGPWYHTSWKGDAAKSGGISSNIGIHFFDMLSFLFGELHESAIHHRAADAEAGWLLFDKARVQWFLSINRNHLPADVAATQSTFRSISVDGQEFEFSGGFTDLHTDSYAQILAGDGFGLSDARTSISVVSDLRTAEIDRARGHLHPFLRTG